MRNRLNFDRPADAKPARRRLAWLTAPLVVTLLLGLAIYFASLRAYVSEWITDVPPFIAPLQLLVSLGRPLTLATLVCLGLATRLLPGPASSTPTFILFYAAAHGLIFIKTLLFGDFDFALQLLVVSALVWVVLLQVCGRLVRTPQDVDRVFASVVICVGLFCASAVVQYGFGADALAVAHGRFNGTTGNPQHAAILLGGAFPSAVYFASRSSRLVKAGALLLCAAIVYLIIWTGSRTALVMAAIGFLILLRSSPTLRKYAVLAAIVAVAGGARYFLQSDGVERFATGEDTRSDAWAGMLRGFLDSPVFGAPVKGDRLGFGENSWLAMAENTGVIGLFPLLVFGFGIVRLCLALMKARMPRPEDQLRRDAILATLGALLFGSITEAYLLGTLSSPVFMIVVISVSGRRLLRAASPARMARRRPLHQPAPTPARSRS